MNTRGDWRDNYYVEAAYEQGKCFVSLHELRADLLNRQITPMAKAWHRDGAKWLHVDDLIRTAFAAHCTPDALDVALGVGEAPPIIRNPRVLTAEPQPPELPNDDELLGAAASALQPAGPGAWNSKAFRVLRWAVFPFAALAGASAIAAVFVVLSWLLSRWDGNAEIWIKFIIPVFAAATFGYLVSCFSYKIAPSGKKTAAIAMTAVIPTIYAVASFGVTLFNTYPVAMIARALLEFSGLVLGGILGIVQCGRDAEVDEPWQRTGWWRWPLVPLGALAAGSVAIGLAFLWFKMPAMQPDSPSLGDSWLLMLAKPAAHFGFAGFGVAFAAYLCAPFARATAALIISGAVGLPMLYQYAVRILSVADRFWLDFVAVAVAILAMLIGVVMGIDKGSNHRA
jgi:hypothetical protein